MLRSAIACALLLIATTSTGQEPEPVATTAIVPVVGNVPGAMGERWITSVELRNDTQKAMEVWLVLPSSPEAPAHNLSLAPGQVVLMPDVIGDAFGSPEALSPLKVITGGPRSVTIRIAVQALREGAVTTLQPIPVEYTPAFHPIRTLTGLSFSDDFRTNVGLVNLDEEREAVFVVALRRLSGRNIGITRLSVGPAGIVHTSIQSLFPFMTKGDDFALVIECMNPATYVYGSVIRNASSEARFVSPAVGAAFDSDAVPRSARR